MKKISLFSTMFLLFCLLMILFSSCDKNSNNEQQENCQSCQANPIATQSIAFKGDNNSLHITLGQFESHNSKEEFSMYRYYRNVNSANEEFEIIISFMQSEIYKLSDKDINVQGQTVGYTVFVKGDIEASSEIHTSQIVGFNVYTSLNDKGYHQLYVRNESGFVHVPYFDAEANGIVIGYISTIAKTLFYDGMDYTNAIRFAHTNPDFPVKYKMTKSKNKLKRKIHDLPDNIDLLYQANLIGILLFISE